MDLFTYQQEKTPQSHIPLAMRMRPQTLEGFVGQEEILHEGSLLFRAIKGDKLMSVIFFGPPGSGKTTLAQVIANTTKAGFVKMNAVTIGVKEIRQVVEAARVRQKETGQKTVLFLDEIHRFNKAQQDALLPYVEEGLLTLIGATTENPYFSINSALLSRSMVFRLSALQRHEMRSIIEHALKNEQHGLGNLPIRMDKEALEYLIDLAQGDARIALNGLELAVLTAVLDENGHYHIRLQDIEASLQHKKVSYDKSGDNHYDNISAFIKSMRGSDPDAAVYWLAKMLVAGEDPLFIARRVLICAAEDVGNADPQALVVAQAAFQSVQVLGMPEARIPLAQAVTYIAAAPKSNAAYMAINKAMDDIRKEGGREVPLHLRDAHYPGAKKLGHGIGYAYAHDYPGNYVKQQYLPDDKVGTRYYEPTENGKEKFIKEWLGRLR